MGTQILVSILVTLSIVASGLLMANAQKINEAAKPQATQAAMPEAGKKAGDKASKTETPAGQSDQSDTVAAPPLPMLMELSTVRDTYRATEDIMVKAELWAVQPVTICLYPDHPEANFSVDIYRAGYGKLPIPPSVVQLSPMEQRAVERVKLAPGQMHRVVFNVKRLAPMPPAFWKTGEYRMQLKFFLCGKTEQAEQAIPSQGPLHLLVLE